MEFDAVYSVKNEFSEDEFKRQLLIALGMNAETPVDVVDCKISSVKSSVREVIVCTANVEGVCNASIGYDRQEPYTDYETYRERVGNTYVTRRREVVKYRTVTDWRPFNTTYSGSAISAAYNDDSVLNLYAEDIITTALTTTAKENIVQEGEALVSREGLNNALALCELEVEAKAVSFPGDRHKDQTYNSSSEIQRLSCYKLPMYTVNYTYNGIRHEAWAFACGKYVINTDMPKAEVGVGEIVNNITKTDKLKSKMSMWSFILTFILAVVLSYNFDFYWAWPLPLLSLICYKLFNTAYVKKFAECADDVTQKLYQTKLEQLQNALSKNGLKKATSRETQDAWAYSSDTEIEKPKKAKASVVLFGIVLAIYMIVCAFGIYNNYQDNYYSPRQLELNVVSKESKYDPDASPYINGCYYVYFDYEIEAKDVGIDYVELKVYVSDKDGNELGFIRSSLSDVGADAGETTTITTMLKENQPEKDEFFTELYNAEFSDLRFTYEIGSIKFSNGKYYFNDEYDKFN